MGIVKYDFAYIDPFTTIDVSGVTFGDFEMGRFIASQPNATPDDDNPDVADSAAVGSVPASCRSMVPAWRYINMLNARIACANMNNYFGCEGIHLATVFEKASMAFLSEKLGTMPHGNNKSVNPPADYDYPNEMARVDRAAIARNATWYASLVGSGPATWAHNHRADGVHDLNGNMWEWEDGLLLMPATQNDSNSTKIGSGDTSGHVLVLASTNVDLLTCPYGRSTATGVASLTDGIKNYTVNEFQNDYLFDAAGVLHKISSHTATVFTLTGSATPTAGPYTILKYVATNITAGMSSGNRILTLRNSDADLKPFGIPATSDGTGSATYGNDGYWFSVSALRAALRGGDWDSTVVAGVFALVLNNAPSNAGSHIGFRAARAI